MNTDKTQSRWIPLLSMCVALAGILSGVVIHYMDVQNEIRLKKYEVTFLERRDSYVSFVTHFTNTIESVVRRASFEDMLTNYHNVEAAYYAMYPYYGKERNTKSIHAKIMAFGMSCEKAWVELRQGKMNPDEAVGMLNNQKEEIFDLLYQELFADLIPR